MKEIFEIYERKILESNDINEHLPTLYKYAKECDVIVELGVRSVVSTWAFLAGQPKQLVSVDMVHPNNYINHDPYGCRMDLVESYSKNNNIDFKFILSDSVVADIPNCDLIFFDTLHTYRQLKLELDAHAHKCGKYLLFHDTVSFAYKGERPGEEGILRAITEFLSQHKNWVLKEEFQNNNGLTVLEKIN